jgi:hypothetical protein
MNIDHIQPLASGGNNNYDNLQILCKPCHYVKTKQETDNHEYFKISETHSSFNENVRNIVNSELSKVHAFVESLQLDKPSGFNSTVYTLDINRCRKNCVLNNQHRYPVFTCMDQVSKFEPTMKIKSGMYYIENDTYFPLRGNGWYREHLTKYCLEKNIIKLSDIKFVIYSSCSIKPDYFNDMVNHFEDVFNNDAKFAKKFIHRMLKTKT